MSSSETSGRFTIYDRHIPSVHAGVFKLEVTQRLKSAEGVDFETVSAPVDFCLGGSQFTLPPHAVASVFPAVNAGGDFAAVLPHIILRPASLPWERAVQANGNPLNAPWLALLVLDSAEMERVNLEKMKRSDLADQAGVADVGAQAEGDTLISVVSLSGKDARHFVPSPEELPWLAHVRASNDHDAVAVLVASRKAAPSSVNHVLLVSVENYYETAPERDAQIILPVLHRWSFVCQTEHTHGFVPLLTQSESGTEIAAELTLPTSTDDPLEADRYARGMLPMRLHSQSGKIAPAWYHGPLRPRPANATQSDARQAGADDIQQCLLPARNARELIVNDSDFGMPQSGYAAAWELGRLVALQHSDIATSIYAWKRHFAQCCDHHDSPNQVPATLSCLLAEGFGAPEHHVGLPENVARWINGNLFNLAEVPFRYLVPDQGMLPARSIRFFDVDPVWLDTLRDGALSLGRVDNRTLAHEKRMRQAMDPPPKLSGFLLRSELVSDFPDLQIDGYAKGYAPEVATQDGLGGEKLNILRREKLSNAVLLVLFEGALDTLDLHLKPQAMHFELPEPDDKSLAALLSRYKKTFEGITDHMLPNIAEVDQIALLNDALMRPFEGPALNPVDAVVKGIGQQLVRLLPKQTKAAQGYQVRDDDAMADQIGNYEAFLKQLLARGNNLPARAPEDGEVAEFAKQMLTNPPLVRFNRTQG